MIYESLGLVAGTLFPATSQTLKVCVSMKKKFARDAQSGSSASQEL
jgi:hypothetical protein